MTVALSFISSSAVSYSHSGRPVLGKNATHVVDFMGALRGLAGVGAASVFHGRAPALHACHFTITSPIAHGAGQPCAAPSGISTHAGHTGHTTGQVSGPLTNVQNRAHFGLASSSAARSHSAAMPRNTCSSNRRTSSNCGAGVCRSEVLSMDGIVLAVY